jgi:hypothetical protein
MLDALGNLGDFLGGIAVIITIVYLAVQVRQNTAALRVQSRQEIVESYRSFNRPFISDATVAPIWDQGLRSFPNQDEPDRSRFVALLVDQILHFQAALALHESRSLDDETFRAYRDHCAALLSTPGGAAFWTQAHASYPSHMVASLQHRIAQGDLPALLSVFSMEA